jgi:hypothetical protein
MKIPKGPTVKQLMNEISHLRPEHRATASEKAKVKADLMRRYPYLFQSRRGKAT